MEDMDVLPEDRFAPGTLERAVLLDDSIGWAPYTTETPRHHCCEHPATSHRYYGCYHCPCVVAWGGIRE